MEDHRNTMRESARTEHCPKCNSTSTRNNMYFCKGEKIRVYIECVDCGEFVARYTLSAYTSDRSYESLLQSLRFTRINSGKKTKHMIECFEEDVKKEFKHVLSLISQHEDERRMEEIIEEDFPG